MRFLLAAFPLAILAATLLVAAGCKPAVLTFTAAPTDISRGDTIHLEWKTRGEAHMTAREIRLRRPPDTVAAIEFLVTATKGRKTSAAQKQQVTIWSGIGRDEVVLTLEDTAVDMLIYRTNKDASFQGFHILTLRDTASSGVTVIHEDKVVTIQPGGQENPDMKGLPYQGNWELRIKMTQQQQQDRHTRPNRFALFTTIAKN